MRWLLLFCAFGAVCGRAEAGRYDPLGGLTIGPRLAYYYYHELFPYEETRAFLGVDSLVGEPKSSEYGFCHGIALEYFVRLPGNAMFLRPRLDAFLGPWHTYDGSTQGQLYVDPHSGDTLAFFVPVSMRKNNFFVSGGLEVGAGYLTASRGLGVWSGIDLRLWSRHLDQSFKEYYYWATLPLGVLAYYESRSRVRLGVKASLSLFLAGNMQIREQRRDSQQSTPQFPAVHLGDSAAASERIGFAVSLPLQIRASAALSIRVTPWFEYYRFGKSNIDTVWVYTGSPSQPVAVSFYEPASRSYWWGIALDVVLHRRL